MSKKFYLLFALTLALAASAFALWCVNKKAMAPVVTQPTPTQTSGNESIDTSDWKTYRNEEYGFEVEYPGGWITEEFNSAGVGAPFDCKRTPEKCTNFSVKFFSPDKTVQPVVFETSKRTTTSMSKNPDAVELPTWNKNVLGKEFVKSNDYFEIFGMCFTTAGIENVKLKKDVNFYFFSFYQPKGLTIEEIDGYCSKEIPDEVFDKIVGSFTVIP